MEAKIGKKSSKQTTTNEPPKWARPYLEGAAGTIQNVVNQNQPNLQAISSQIGGYLPGLGAKAFGPNPMLDKAGAYATDVIGGKYLNSNPYLEGMIGATANDVQDRVNSLFGRVGGSLGSPHAKVLSSELANAENSMRFNNYQAERQNQQGAASLIPGLNASQYAGVAPFLGAAQTAGTLPYAGIGNLGMIGGLFGGYGTQKGTQPGGWGTDLLNAAATIGSAAIMASERRLKDDIEEIGEWGSTGLPAYRFRYKNDPSRTMHEGVMVEDVERIMPQALGPVLHNGVRTVNYAVLGAR